MDIQRNIRYGLSFALTLLFLLHVTGTLPLPLFNNLENQAYDARLKLTLPSYVDKQVVIIDIDEKSIAEIGRWPWNRDVMAKIMDSLFDHYRIKEIGFDIVFAEADIDEGGRLLEQMASGSLKSNQAFLDEYHKVMPSLQRDALFAKSLLKRKSIMGFVMDTRSATGSLPHPVAELGKDLRDKLPLIKPQGFTANLDIFQRNASGGGFFDNPLIDNDGVFRRVPLLQEYDGKLYESFALALARSAIDSPQIELIVESDDSGTLFLEAVKIGEKSIPVDGKAGALVPFIGAQKSFDYFPAVDVLNKSIDISKLKDKIAIFGTSATGLLDMRTTPLDTVFPGVEVHANIVQGILDERMMHRPGYSKGFEFLILILLGISLTFLLPLLSPLWGLIASVVTVLFIVVTNFYLWTVHQLVFPVATPVFLTMLIFVLNMTYGFFIEERGKRHIAHLFGQYIPPELVDEMSLKHEKINLEGEMREMTVLFSDVRGFTTISEGMEPEELTKFINAFLTPITAIIHNERGTIDKYMGDAVMAFWGAPLEDSQHALHALTAAVKMIERMQLLTDEFEANGWPPIKVGVGINTGMMNVGNKGSEFRVDYTILGDAVNLGSRLEGLTKNYGVDIIVGEATRHAVPEFEYRELDRVRVKGKDEPVSIYEPVGLLTELDNAIAKDLKQYNRGLKYYREQKWDDADREFLALHSMDKDRLIYQMYLDRIMGFRDATLAEDWDGVFTHTSK